MKKRKNKNLSKSNNLIYVLIIIAINALIIIILLTMPDYLRKPSSDYIPLHPNFILVFLIIDIILIGIPAGFHKIYINDYTPIKSLWFFAVFGGITGGLIGERSFIMIIPYAILMLIYAFLYKKFTWWKVAITTYLAAILIENVMNRSPIQIPTLLWIAFFIHPYFITKIWENKNQINLKQLIYDLRYVFLSIIILLILIKFIVKSIPIAFAILAVAIPLFVFIGLKLRKIKKSKII